MSAPAESEGRRHEGTRGVRLEGLAVLGFLDYVQALTDSGKRDVPLADVEENFGRLELDELFEEMRESANDVVSVSSTKEVAGWTQKATYRKLNLVIDIRPKAQGESTEGYQIVYLKPNPDKKRDYFTLKVSDNARHVSLTCGIKTPGLLYINRTNPDQIIRKHINVFVPNAAVPLF